MKTRPLLQMTALFLIAGTFLSYTATAGDKIGNGGGIWACQVGKKITKGYLVDLYEARLEFGFPVMQTTLTDPKKIAADVFARIHRDLPELAERVRPHMNAVLASMKPVLSALTPVDDVILHVAPLPVECEGGTWGEKPLQFANYKNDGILLIRQDLWENKNIAPLDKGALLWHEAVYRWLRTDFGDICSTRARKIVGLIFSTSPANEVGQKIEDVLTLDVDPCGTIPIPPSPTPAPTPVPTPTPTPTPVPVQPQILCVTENHAANAIYAGYGTTEFLARTSAKAQCKSGPQAFACSDNDLECAPLDVGVTWTCTTTDHQSGKFFIANGASKLEAQYKAQTACYAGGGAFPGGELGGIPGGAGPTPGGGFSPAAPPFPHGGFFPPGGPGGIPGPPGGFPAACESRDFMDCAQN